MASERSNITTKQEKDTIFVLPQILFLPLDSISLSFFFFLDSVHFDSFHFLVLHSLYATKIPVFFGCKDWQWEIPPSDSSWIAHGHVSRSDEAHGILDTDGFTAKPGPVQKTVVPRLIP